MNCTVLLAWDMENYRQERWSVTNIWNAGGKEYAEWNELIVSNKEILGIVWNWVYKVKNTG